MARATARRPAPARGGASPEARAALLEALLEAPSARDCAARAASWLAERAGARLSLCATPRGHDPVRLVGLAGHGLSDDAVAAFGVDLDAEGHPLCEVLSAPRPRLFRRAGEAGLARPPAPLGQRPFFALGLCPAQTEARAGLLLFSPPAPGAMPAVRWAAGALATSLVRLAAHELLRAQATGLGRERALLLAMLDAAPDPLLLTNPQGHLVLANARARELFTLPGDEGEPRARRAVHDNDARFRSFVSAVPAASEPPSVRGELSLAEPRSGASLPVEAIARRLVSPEGLVTAVVTTLHDRREAIETARLYEQLKRASDELEETVHAATAELVKQNELLQRQRLELEQASALKSQFLANMSHEFRTPLNAILGYTSMLLQGVAGELSPQQKKMLGRVDSNGHNLLSIINDILDITRIEAGRMPLHLSAFQLADLVDEVVSEVEPLISRARATVSVELASDLPVVTSDRQKVKQIVLNLLTNALKFTPQGAVRVRCEHDRSSKALVVSVADSGIGIAESDQATIFEDFRQADSSPTRQYGGAGLGLAICRRLATMLGGQITLASKLGEGSTFTLSLPRRPRRR